MSNFQAANLHLYPQTAASHGPFLLPGPRLERSGAKKGRSSQGLGLVRCGTMHRLDHLEVSKKYLPSWELTYLTWGKGKSSSKCHFWGIC